MFWKMPVMLQLNICGRKNSLMVKTVYRELKLPHCNGTPLVSAGCMLTIKLSSVSEQTQSGSLARSNTQLCKWFLVQFCLSSTENLPNSSQLHCKSWHYLVDCYGYNFNVHGVKGNAV